MLYTILHDVLNPTLSFHMAVTALLYDMGDYFRYRDHAPESELVMPRLRVGCSVEELFDGPPKPINFDYVDFGALDQDQIEEVAIKSNNIERKKWARAQFDKSEEDRGSSQLSLFGLYFLRKD